MNTPQFDASASITSPEQHPTSQLRQTAINMIMLELAHQDIKWGADRVHPSSLWLTILVEEIGEVARAILEHDPKNYVDELADVAAVAISAIQSVLLDAERAKAKAAEQEVSQLTSIPSS